jgi:hypothetical protein
MHLQPVKGQGQHLNVLKNQSSFYTLCANVPMVLNFGFIAPHLPVQLVSQLIDSGIQIGMRTLRKQITALDMNIALCSLAFFLLGHVVNGQDHPDINDLVKMPGNTIQLAHHIAAKCRGNLKVVTANRQVHKDTPFPNVGTG